MPRLKRVTKKGKLGIDLSSEIKVKNFDQILDLFRGNNRKLASEIEQKTVPSFSEIDKIDALFKAAGFIIVKFIPGGNLEGSEKEAREFNWKLESYTEKEIGI